MTAEKRWMKGRTSLAGMLALVAGVVACGGDAVVAPEQTHALLEPVRPGVTAVLSGKSTPTATRVRLAEGDEVKTDDSGRAAVHLDTGALVVLDEKSTLKIAADGVTLSAGRAWIDAEGGGGVRVESPGGVVNARDAGIGVAVRGNQTILYVAQGEALYSVGGRRELVRSGQSATLSGDGATVVNARLWDDWTGGLASAGPRESVAEGVGEIWARLPDSLGEARWPLAIRTLDVRVTIRHDLAITEVDQSFFNPASDTVEGLYRVRVPRGALLQRFAVDRDGQLVESVVKEKALARQRYDEQVYQGSTEDPALLEWEAADQYRARIYPIAPGSTRRIVIRYAEWIGSSDARRTYRYPIGRGPRVQELSLEVDLKEAGAKSIRAGLGARKVGDRVVLVQSDFQPRADFWLDLIGVAPAQGSATAYRAEHHPPPMLDAPADPDINDYFLTQIRPQVDGDLEIPNALDLVLLVDLSAGTDATRLELGRSVVESILRNLGPTDRVSVVAADVSMHGIGDRGTRLESPTDETKEAILDALARAPAGGATDLGAALADAAALLERGRAGAVVYIGDAFPTVGELDLPSLRKRLDRLPLPPRLYGVAVGAEAQLDLLDGLVRRGGLALRVESRKDAAEAAMELLQHASRPLLTDVVVELGPGIDRVYPRSAVSVVAGEPLTVVGRIRDNVPGEVTVRGKHAGRAFEQKLKMTTTEIADANDLRLRWAGERLQQLLSEGAGREAIVEVGTRYGLLTPFTSYYVPSKTELGNDGRLRELLDRRRNEEERAGWRTEAPVPPSGWAFGCSYDRAPATSEGEAPGFLAPPPMPPQAVSATGATAPPADLAEPLEEIAQDQDRSAGTEGHMGRREAQAGEHRFAIQGPTGGSGVAQGYGGDGSDEGGRARTRATSQPTPSTIVPSPDPAARPARAPAPSTPGAADFEQPAQQASARNQAVADAPAEPEMARRRIVDGRMSKTAGVLGSLRGDQVADDFGAVGLGVRGAGRGGGGTGEGTIGLGGLDMIGHGRDENERSGEDSWDADNRELDNLIANLPSITIDPGRHAARRCSAGSRQRLADRIALWRERLQSRPGIDGAMGVVRQARGLCELPGWRDRRALLGLLLDAAAADNGPHGMIELFNQFDGSDGIQSFLRREILGRVRTPADLRVVHEGLGERGGVDWTAVEQLLAKATTRAQKVKTARDLLRRWPDDLRLSLRLFGLLEEISELREARRLAAVIRANPYADASARTLVGEFYLRQRDEAAARRTWSEIVEFAPYDPYARRWLGDLYRAAGWFEDAYRQYETLQTLTPDDDGVLLLLASAAAGAGRVDEALRLEARVSRNAEPGFESGNARIATLLSGMRLAGLRMAAAAANDQDALAKVQARSAQSGALRDAGVLRAYLSWAHPDAGTEMWTAPPDGVLNRPEDMGGQFGIEAWNVLDLSAGPVRVEVRHPDAIGMRTVHADLLLVWNEGQPTERVERIDLAFDRTHRVHAFSVDAREHKSIASEWTPPPTAPAAQEVAQ